jgi:hypothetical protein
MAPSDEWRQEGEGSLTDSDLAMAETIDGVV